MEKSTCDCYDTAKQLADGAVRQNKMAIQDVLERGGGIIKPKSNKYLVAPTLFCDESQRNIAETRLHPIQGTMKLRAAIPLANGNIAVRDTVSAGSVTMMESLTFRRARGELNTH